MRSISRRLGIGLGVGLNGSGASGEISPVPADTFKQTDGTAFKQTDGSDFKTT